MSNRSCNKCVFGKVDIGGSEVYCKACILRSEFVASRTPTRVLANRQPVKDDRV